MNGTPPIVVGYDGSAAANTALTWAAKEADRIKAPVKIVLILHWPAQLAAMLPAPSVFPDERAQRAAEKVVRLAAEKVRRQQPGLTVTGHVRVGTIVPDLVYESTRARVIVLGHGNHVGFPRLLLGSIGVNVAAQAHCPVIIIPSVPATSTVTGAGAGASGPAADGPAADDLGVGGPGMGGPAVNGSSVGGSSVGGPSGERGTVDCANHGWGLPATEQILVGFDYAACATKAIDVAFRVAAAQGIGVHLLRAWRAPTARRGTPASTEDPGRLALAEHLAVVDAIQPWRRVHPRVPVTVDLVADEPGHALISGSADARLVVVGSCGHGTVRCLLFGSVSRRVARHARCPVIVVRELPDSEISTTAA